jgi:hypothetical protein
VSAATYEATRGEFEYECRGAVQVKGKGEMTTYFLQSRRALAAGRPTSLPNEPVASS